ncbi:copper resistance CopC family protein [Methylocella sp.]|uniref:copper resistance CopC family protein n=1 Tax=Methylocella sp. TaxID=1978226 RepID=UPI003785124F
MKLRFSAPTAALLAALSAAPGAFAHAVVADAVPAAGSSVSAAGTPVRLHFNSRVDHARSKLVLVGPDGAEVPLALEADSPADGLNAAATPLAPGAWKLRWQVLSVDGHITHGEIPFTVK